MADFGVAIKPLDLKSADKAGAPKNLHRIAGLGNHHIAGEEFCHRAGGIGGLVIIDEECGVMHERPCGGDLLRHIGEHPLQSLIIDDGAAKLTPCLCVVERGIKPCLCNA